MKDLTKKVNAFKTTFVLLSMTLMLLPTGTYAELAAFQQRYTTNLIGNLKVIGNTVLQFNGNINGRSNAQLNLSYVNIDGSNGTLFNASSATINMTEAGVDIRNAHIIWAGLYWQGYLHNDTADTGIDNIFNFSTNQNTANNQIPNFIQNQSILFKVGNNSYQTVTPDDIGIDQQYNRSNYVSYKYAAFADVTNLLKSTAPNAEYTVANIPTRSGRTGCGNWVQTNNGWQCADNFGNRYDGLGNYGAWALVVVYDNSAIAQEKTRNITIFDGYTVLSAANNPQQTINLSGFRTPSDAPNGVDSTLSIFAGEGDRNILGDFARLTNQDGYTWDLPDTSGAGSYFASVIEGVPNRNPVILNNNGIDIHTTQVGTSGGNDRPIKEKQTLASITLGTTQDTFMPSMIAFATELYTPRICYDYSARIGDHIKLSSENRDINTSYWGGEPLILKVFIRSMEADFELIHTNMKIDFTPSGKFDFIEHASTVSPSNINAYLPTYDTNASTISIGRNNSPTGGEIGANESTYAKVGFNFLTTNYINSHFELDIKTAIQFDPNAAPVTYTLTTRSNANDASQIGLCPRNHVYDPVYGAFNIERSNSKFTQSKAIRYPLYTQITGKDFNVSVASYGGSNFDQKQAVSDTTVELELIDAGGFDNNSSAGYDSVCEEPEAIGGEGALIYFDNTSRVQVDVRNKLNYPNDLALQSAAFRVWLLTKADTNNTGTRLLVKHHCTDKTDQSCFKKVYDDNYKNDDDKNTHYCSNACKSSGTGCYTCLKKYFAIPVCSRDNFSIRPESFRISINDNNESNSSSSKSLTVNSNSEVDPNLTLAAGYKYMIDINATRYKSRNFAKGYYNNHFKEEENITILNPNNKIVAPLVFNDKAACTDQTHHSYRLKLQNGQLDKNTTFSHYNVGTYKFHMYDNNWTNVDQASYPYKTVFDPNCKNNSSDPKCNDCLVNNSTSSDVDYKIGCNIDSAQKNSTEHILLPLRFEPYAFSLAEVNLSVLPDNNATYLFMNDFNNAYYKNKVLHPLTMSASYIGQLKAISKTNIVTTNFTNGCAAQDVNLHIIKTTVPVTINDSKGNPVPFEQFLQFLHEDNTSTTSPLADSTTAPEGNTTLPKNAFLDTKDQGIAQIFLHTNFKKPLNSTVNPIDINYTGLYAYSPNASSSANMLSNYIPDGDQTYNRNLLYYFAKITPKKKLYDNVKTSSIYTPLFVDIYCSLTDCNQTFDLSQPSHGDNTEAEWYSATMFDQNSDGTTDLSIKTIFGDDAGPQVNPNDDVMFDDGNGTQNDINVSLTTSARPSTVEIEIQPVPWLLYDKKDPTGFPHYRVKFIGDSAWSGVGDVGHAIEATSNQNPDQSRMNW